MTHSKKRAKHDILNKFIKGCVLVCQYGTGRGAARIMPA